MDDEKAMAVLGALNKCEQELAGIRRLLIHGDESASSTADLVLKSVMDRFSVTLNMIRGKARTRAVADARHAAVYWLREECGLSWGDVGKLIDRDHTTAIYAHRKVQLCMQRDPAFRACIESVGRMIRPEANADAV